MFPVLILQNDPQEGGGSLTRLMASRGLSQYIVQGEHAPYDDLEQRPFSALVVLGGAQSAFETDKYPYLNREMALCRQFIAQEKPVIGFCLGAQILAMALGGDVRAADVKEIGWYDISLLDEGKNDALFVDQPTSLLSYHFHGDAIHHVPECTLLASSAMTQWQAFRYGSCAYGFQYHAEADGALLADMCRNNTSYLAANGIDADALVSASQHRLPGFEQNCSNLLQRWLDLFSTRTAA